ncbi:MAG: cell division topological specificity factor MinE [Thiomargarita sp.]|nr:cell division topological specificity factor MinE [Thiomargarita sp.]
MGIFSYFQHSKRTASVAKERLQIIVTHERHLRNSPKLSYLPLLQQELLEVVRKYVSVREEHIKVNIEKTGDYEILEVNVTLPDREEHIKA